MSSARQDLGGLDDPWRKLQLCVRRGCPDHGKYFGEGIVTMRIAVGDQVRVHHHPPGLRHSFAEGVVRQVDVTTLRGRGFVVGTTREVILGRERTIGSDDRHFALYEHHADFPGRIEMLSRAEQPVRLPEGETPLETDADAVAEADRVLESTTDVDGSPEPDRDDRQAARGLGNVISAVFGRRS
jgi:hypothetical protein